MMKGFYHTVTDVSVDHSLLPGSLYSRDILTHKGHSNKRN
jgi:hypothetical protein